MEFSKSSSRILTGPVVVTRNPCLHPGDVRQLTAVSVPQLAHFLDCIVFPNHGPRPHPSEMAGITIKQISKKTDPIKETMESRVQATVRELAFL